MTLNGRLSTGTVETGPREKGC